MPHESASKLCSNNVYYRRTLKTIVNIGGAILLLFIAPSNIKYLYEQQKGKIGTLSPKDKEAIQKIYNHLGYNNKETFLLLTQESDIDFGHAKGSKENMEMLCNKLDVVYKQQDINSLITIAVPGSYYSYKQHHTYLKIKINKKTLLAFEEKFGWNKQENKELISMLLNLAMGEYIEQQQDESIINRRLAGSGHNAADYKGNIWGVIDATHSPIDTSIFNLQQEYGPGNAQYFLRELSKEFQFTYLYGED